MANNNVDFGGAGRGGIRYGECFFNHALPAHLYAVDGCCSFAPGGRDHQGIMQTWLCSCCGCHRNYHKVERTVLSNHRHHLQHIKVRVPNSHPHPPAAPQAFPQYPPPQPVRAPPALAPPAEEEEEEIVMREKQKKSKFTCEQRELMREFAHERLGWRWLKSNEDEAEEFCLEIGVDPNVFKNWVGNNRRRNNYRPGPRESSSAPAQKKNKPAV